MSWQKLKLKRLKLKSEIPNTSLIAVTDIILNKQTFAMLMDKDDRIYFHNIYNDKWYELVNEIK